MILYKYLKPDKNTLKVIKSNKFCFSKPRTFNDPFDGFISLPKESSFEETLKHINANTKHGNPYGDSEYRDLLIEYIKDNDLKSLINTIYLNDEYSYIENALSDVGVLCLSGEELNPLMWSHYAEGHSGICIGIEIDDLQSHDDFIFTKINYTDERPIINTNKLEDPDNIQKILGTKHLNWQYENEYRVITKNPILEEERALIHLPIKIKEIIFGIKSKNIFVEKIKKIRNPDFKYYQLTHNYFDFKLRKLPLNF